MPDPLPIDRDHWCSRWLVIGRRPNVLHRIASIEWDKDYDEGEMIAGHGIAVCGLKQNFHMPGILSRMDRKRCPRCCKALGIPEGYGAPFNAFQGEEFQDV